MGDRYEITGLRESRHVLVDGRRVPFLDALLMPGGKISLILDSRYGLDISVADAEAFIPWIANAIAVAMGYTCHPAGDKEPRRSNPFTREHIIDGVYHEDGDAQ